VWFYRYCFGRRSFESYSGLFLPDQRRVAGDISPPYYGTPEQRIRELSNFNNDIKILIFIRNPIEWAWSLALMALCQDRGRNFVDVEPAEFIKFFDDIFTARRSYVDTIRLWRDYFSDVFVGYYDALKEDSTRFFHDICEFLEIQKHVVAPSLLHQQVNSGLNLHLPTRFAAHLCAQYHDEIMSLVRRYGSPYPHRWAAEWYPKAVVI
jgi:hypothetical protein